MTTADTLAYRKQLVAAAVGLEQGDRVPLVYQAEAFSPRFTGMTMAEYCSDPDAPVRAGLAALERLGGFDAQNYVPGGAVELVAAGWLTKVRLPGRELEDDVQWQLDEHEDLTVAEYDRILEEGWGPVFMDVLARVMDPEAFGESIQWLGEHFPDIAERFRAIGVVPMAGAGVVSPFEALSGARSMPQFFMDLYRRPELVKRVMDRMLPDLLAEGLEAARASGLKGVWVTGVRSASGMVSEKVWMEFIFPHLKEITWALADEGFWPILHFDQDWTRDLPHLRELPAKSCILHTDGMTDIRRAKELLGDHMALMGDVPSSMLVTASPEEVRAYVRDLIRDVGDRGFLLCPGCDGPINAKPENMMALRDAGLEFGC